MDSLNNNNNNLSPYIVSAFLPRHTGHVEAPTGVEHLDTVRRFLEHLGLRKTLDVFLSETKTGPVTTQEKGVDSGVGWSSQSEEGKEAKASTSKDPDKSLFLVAEDIWARLETKYRRKMKEAEEKRSRELKRRISEIERRFKSALQRKEDSLRESYQSKLTEMEKEEQNLLSQLHQDKLTASQREGQRRSELLGQVRELDRRRLQLQQLEDEFSRHMEEERKKLGWEREEVARRETEVRKQEVSLDSRLGAARAEALAFHRSEHAHLLARAKEEARESERELATTRDALLQLQSAAQTAETRLKRISQLEGRVQTAQSEADARAAEAESLRAALRERQDYAALKETIAKLRAEAEGGGSTEAEGRLRIVELELKHERSLRSEAERREAEARSGRNALSEKYEALVERLGSQSAELTALTREVARLKASRTPSAVKKRGIATRFELSSADPSSTDNDITPPILRNARQRLAQLDMESRTLDKSLRQYQRVSEAETAALRQVQATSTPYVNKASQRKPESPELSPIAKPVKVEEPRPSPRQIPAAPIPTTVAPPPKQKPRSTPKAPPKAAPTPAVEDNRWAAELERRERERVEREEALRRQAEELVALQKAEQDKERKLSVEKEPEKSTKDDLLEVKEPDIDPEMQKYMALLMAQRKNESAPKTKAKKVVEDVEDPKISPG